MASSVYGSVPYGDLQAGEHLIDGQTIAIALQPQAARSGLTALAGGGALGATLLLPGLNEIDTVVSAADSCLLPLALAGTSVAVYAATTNATTVWPQQSNPNNAAAAADTIVNLAGSTVASLSCTGNTVQFFRCFKAGTWKATI